MEALFLTDNLQPVKHGTYPAEVRILVDEFATPPLYLEQRYYSNTGALLEKVSTLIPEALYGGQVVANLNYNYLLAAAYFDVQVVTTNNQALATGGRVSHTYTPPPAALPQFMTSLKSNRLYASYPASVSILIDQYATPPLYFERRYLNYDGSELEIKSTEIPLSFYGRKLGFKINENALPCAAGLEVSIQTTNRSYGGVCPSGEPIPSGGIFDFTFDTTFE